MNNIAENVVANVLVLALSATLALLLRAFGVSTPNAVWAALLVLATLYLIMRSVYPRYLRGMTLRLVKRSLEVNPNDADAVDLKDQVVEMVTRSVHGSQADQQYFINVYPNQEACESKIKEAFRRAKKVKILTIRGERYFSGKNSLLYDICKYKSGGDCQIQVLVLSPNADHITDSLAASLGHSSSERTKRKMWNTLHELKQLEVENNRLQVRCFNETPNFKMLLFDDAMFISAYIKSKNDRDTQMVRVTREHPILYTGLERDFDDLWKRAVTISDVLDGRVGWQ